MTLATQLHTLEEDVLPYDEDYDAVADKFTAYTCPHAPEPTISATVHFFPITVPRTRGGGSIAIFQSILCGQSQVPSVVLSPSSNNGNKALVRLLCSNTTRHKKREKKTSQNNKLKAEYNGLFQSRHRTQLHQR